MDGVEIGSSDLSRESSFVEAFLSRASVAAIMAVNLSLELLYLGEAGISMRNIFKWSL